MTQSNILLLEAIESTLRAANLTSNAMILKAIIEEEKNIQLDAPVSAENGGKYVREGELIRKTVAHDETILYIGESDDQVVIAYPTDLDDFVQVGNYVKITLELE